MQFTAEAVAKIKGQAARREIQDSLCPGLYLIVQPSGVKSWAVRYRFNGRRFKVTLGGADVIPLAETAEARKARLARDPASDPPDARGLARSILSAVASGRNPATERKEARRMELSGQGAADLIGTVWDEYAERHLDRNLKASSAERFKGIFEKHILPTWKDRRLGEISKRDVLNVLDEAGKRGPYAANSALTVLSAFFNWALGRDMIRISPCAGVQKPSAEVSRDRVLSDNELKDFWKGCKKLGFVFGPLFQMLLLTGARRTEVAEMRHSELDLEKQLWTIPGARTKNGKEHKIYLSDAALAILKSLPKIGGCKFVFSTNGDAPSSGFSKAKARLDKSTPKIAEYRLHDLRRTAATGMARLGIALPVVEKALNHTSGSFAGIVGTYNRHTFAEETKAAFEAWGGYVARLVSGDAANVIELRPEKAPALAG